MTDALVERKSAALRREPREEELQVALRQGAGSVVVPGILGGALLAPLAIGWGLPWAIRLARTGLPDFLSGPFAAALLLLLPVVCALPAGLMAARTTRKLAEQNRDLARAAGAGAGLMAAGFGALWLAVAAAVMRLPLEALVFLPQILLAVVTVGGLAFRGASNEGEGVPVLYRGLAVFAMCGLGGFFMVAAFGWLVFQTPPLMALLEWLTASPTYGLLLKYAVLIAPLAPLTYGVARGLRRRLPDVPGWVPALGLMAPVLGSLLYQLTLPLRYGHLTFELLLPGFLAVSGTFLGALPHLVAIRLAGASRDAPRQIAPAKGPPELPEKSVEPL